MREVRQINTEIFFKKPCQCDSAYNRILASDEHLITILSDQVFKILDRYFLLGITPDDDNLLFLLNGGKSQSITPPPSDPTSSSTQDSRLPDAAKLEEEVSKRIFYSVMHQFLKYSFSKLNTVKCVLTATFVVFCHQSSCSEGFAVLDTSSGSSSLQQNNRHECAKEKTQSDSHKPLQNPISPNRKE